VKREGQQSAAPSCQADATTTAKRIVDRKQAQLPFANRDRLLERKWLRELQLLQKVCSLPKTGRETR